MITGVYQYVDPLLELSSLFRFVSSYCLILIVKLLEISGRFLVDYIQQVQTGGEGANPLKSSIATQLSLHKIIPAYSVRRRLHSFYNGSCSWQKDSKHFSTPLPLVVFKDGLLLRVSVHSLFTLETFILLILWIYWILIALLLICTSMDSMKSRLPHKFISSGQSD